MPAPLNRFHASRPELRDGAPHRESLHITVTEVSHGYGDRLLLDRVNLVISEGERVAVVGENGAGKSTLLRLLSGDELPEAGTVAVHGRASRLAQTYDGAATVGGILAAGAERVAAALAAERGEPGGEDPDLDEAGSAVVRTEVAAAIALERLGVGHLVRAGRDRALASLSGGEAERIALALALADPAPILLLDEPTNHLDAGALAWLEAEVAARPGIVVAVSHDRDFLERFARVILEVDADTRSVRRYGAGYAGYRAEKARERRDWERRYAEWLAAKEREREKAATVTERVAYGRMTDNDKAGYNYFGQRVSAAVESQIRSARERLRRLEADPVLPPPRPLHLAAAFDVAAGASVVLAGAGVAGRLAPVDLSLAPGDRLLVTGPNGAGKSTLLGLLAGTVPCEGAASATVAHDGGRRPAVVGLLPQELAAPADPDARLLAAYAAGLPGDLDDHAEALMHTGLFRVQDFFVPVGSLSAGQYRRLALARLLAGRPELLLLDEPTNHLAPLLVGELEEALTRYRGTLVVASHDRALARWFDGLGDVGDGAGGVGRRGHRRLLLEPVASAGRLHAHH
ncbi:ABC transporter ATP-binding protein [Sinomonas cyclohexanicum]|uniref:ABC transporter ATP-binding protein n=1 Tax=Sinomonas cyclohexanicum TaxID=322009 RepID=A0ABN6FKY5_SINCY|nr:ATP-binding cassette domain-containing protein [Corynebacterium cyclohexanicum]BCT77388.1 ABC transporter ATP-binding protein [Corynebacterium cyclohexanicum]